MPQSQPQPLPFEQLIMRDKLVVHDAVTLPQRIKRTPMPGDQQPQPGAQPGQPQPGMGEDPSMPSQPTQPPASPQQPGTPQPGMAQPGMPFTSPGMPGQPFGLPPTDPQGMLQELQQRYAGQPQPTG
jgi:arginine/serine-rich splicing factor 15